MKITGQYYMNIKWTKAKRGEKTWNLSTVLLSILYDDIIFFYAVIMNMCFPKRILLYLVAIFSHILFQQFSASVNNCGRIIVSVRRKLSISFELLFPCFLVVFMILS